MSYVITIVNIIVVQAQRPSHMFLTFSYFIFAMLVMHADMEITGNACGFGSVMLFV